MMRRQWGGIGLLALALVLPGCTRTVLNYDKSFKIDPGGEQTATAEAVNKDQKIKVDVSATGSKVDVYVFLEKDKDIAQEAIKGRRTGSPLLASAQDKEGAVLEAAVPAGNAAIVMVKNTSGKSAEVRIKMTN